MRRDRTVAFGCVSFARSGDEGERAEPRPRYPPIGQSSVRMCDGLPSYGAPPEMGPGAWLTRRRPAWLRPRSGKRRAGPCGRRRATSVVQLHMSVAAACLVQAVCFSTALFGNGPISALILSGAGRLRTAASTDGRALSQVDPGSLPCRIDNRITARVRCRLN